MKPSLLLIAGLSLLAGAASSFAADPAAVKETIVSQWKMEAFRGDEVPNVIPNGPPLTVAEPEARPERATDESLKGVLFANGEAFTTRSGEIPTLHGFGTAGEGFAVRLRFRPTETPPGAYGGLFQAMVYREQGFRIVLTTGPKVGVEIFREGEETQGLTSESVLEFHQDYTVEVRFEGNTARLFLNGSLEAEKEVYPTAYTGPITIGRASGKDYYFRGIMEEVTILSLAP